MNKYIVTSNSVTYTVVVVVAANIEGIKYWT